MAAQSHPEQVHRRSPAAAIVIRVVRSRAARRASVRHIRGVPNRVARRASVRHIRAVRSRAERRVSARHIQAVPSRAARRASVRHMAIVPQAARPVSARPAALVGSAAAGSFGGGARTGFGRRGPDLTPSVEKERVSNYDPNKKQYVRQNDPERSRNSGRTAQKQRGVAGSGMNYDDDFVRSRKKKKVAAQKAFIEPIKIEKAFMTAETITSG